MDIPPEMYWNAYFVSLTWINLVVGTAVCLFVKRIADGHVSPIDICVGLGMFAGAGLTPNIFLLLCKCSPGLAMSWLELFCTISVLTLAFGSFLAVCSGGIVAMGCYLTFYAPYQNGKW